MAELTSEYSSEYAQALGLLQTALNRSGADFRPGQWEAIDALVNHRKKLLVVQRTGWGKSLVYFLGCRILRDRGLGPTLIVSPLLALMRNQIDAADRLGIRARSINSTNTDDWPQLIQEVKSGQCDALLISPERLANDAFVEEVLLPIGDRLGLLVVDEAHCISDWGHDFRPDYKRLVNILRLMPPTMPVLGTTATANNRVIDDIVAQLGDIEVQRGPLRRETLELQTLRLPDQAARLAWLADTIERLPGTGIVYTLTKRDADQVAEWLNQRGIVSRAYYSDALDDGFENSNAYRQHLEGLLLGNKIKALVATTALGMGYDKPDLGFVIHYQAPSSIVAYYQQVGRAGRDIERAVGVLLSGWEDDQIHEFFRTSAFPDEEHVYAILEELEASDGLSVMELQRQVNLTKGQIERVLKYLSVDNPAPVLKDGPKWRRTPVAFRIDQERIQRLTTQRLREWEEIQDYIDTDGCLMAHLAGALSDPATEPCGKCAGCLAAPIVPVEVNHGVVTEAARYLKRAEIPLELKKQVAPGAFTEYGFRGNLPMNLRGEPGRILSRWDDAGWGRVVAEDKQGNHFRDALVEAAAEMILERWGPEPRPEWVSCVPSHNHPELVPDFARRLAERLGLPFIAAVRKVRDNEAQGLQRNRFHQCRNLDGVFEIIPGAPATPVLLVDDTLDSGWTMTVIAVLLRQAGCGPVFPMALATKMGR